MIVEGFTEALKNSKAKIILPVNLTNNHEHTLGWKVSDYVKNTEAYLGKPVDFILINTESPSRDKIERYELEEGKGVLVEDDMADGRVIRGGMLSHADYPRHEKDARAHIRSFIRHDSDKLAKVIEKIIA